MAKSSTNCILGEAVNYNCDHACGGCGWNAKVAESRIKEIEAGGLTMGPDGVQRLIVRKGEDTDGNT